MEVGAGTSERISIDGTSVAKPDMVPTLLTKLIDLPILLPNFKNIITNPVGETHPLVEQNSLHLAA